MIGISGSISDGVETEPVSGSPSDLNQAADVVVLSNEFQNVVLDEVSKDGKKMMSVSEGDGKALVEEEVEEEDCVSEEEDESQVLLYPVRPGAEDCAFYMKTGSCKFGSTCKFNHPLPNPSKIQVKKISLLLHLLLLYLVHICSVFT